MEASYICLLHVFFNLVEVTNPSVVVVVFITQVIGLKLVTLVREVFLLIE
jgi:hypothetical protein